MCIDGTGLPLRCIRINVSMLLDVIFQHDIANHDSNSAARRHSLIPS